MTLKFTVANQELSLPSWYPYDHEPDQSEGYRLFKTVNVA